MERGEIYSEVMGPRIDAEIEKVELIEMDTVDTDLATDTALGIEEPEYMYEQQMTIVTRIVLINKSSAW